MPLTSCLVSEIEESMLSSLRPPEHTPIAHRAPVRSDGFSSANHRLPADPSELPPDRLHVEMEMSPDSQILLYGPLLRALVAIKVQICRLDFAFPNWKCSTESEFLLSRFLFLRRKTTLVRMTCTQISRRLCPALCCPPPPPQAWAGPH